MGKVARLIAAWLAVAWLALPAAPSAGAATTAAAIDPAEVTEADRSLRRMERRLRVDESPPSALLRDYLGEIPGVRDLASRCVGQNESALERVQDKLDAFGGNNGVETAGLLQQRDALTRQRNEIEQQLQVCRVLLLRANELQDRVTALKQEQLAQRLRQREPTAWAILRDNLQSPGRLWTSAKLFLLRSSGLDALTWPELIGLLGLLLLGVGGGLFLRTPMYRIAAGLRGGPSLAAGFVKSLAACSASILPALVTSVAAAIYLTLIGVRESGWAFITLLSYGLGGYFLFLYLVRVFLDPRPPAAAYLPAPARTLRLIAGRLQILALVVLVVSLFSATLVVEEFPEPVRRLLRLGVATTLIIELTRIIWLVGGLLRWHDTRLPRLLLSAAMLSALVAEWLGYLNLSEYIAGGLVGSILAFGGAWFVWRMLDDLYDGLDEGRRRWHRSVRESLGVTPDRYMPGLLWVRILTAVAVWGAFVLGILLIWGLSDTGLAFILRLLNDGFRIGRFELVPIKLVYGVIALIMLLGLTGWFKQRLGQRWLARTRMERGAREAVVTVTGYAGVAIAILVGLAIAGVQFTNIALIAGALSVGIGFGLQNIFNNFVSGLILLFERPVKTDDWVVVGATEGLVKKISIRSTQIQTFDHADVIVPNSELIQAQVVNWMLRDPFGRARIPVRVAYGTDPEEVRSLLLEIGNAQPRVIRDAVLAPPPEVLLLRFGDYGFEFELRVFIRDIDYVLQVTSDINFAIERRFRERGIVIPYPRQDVRIDRTPDPWRPEAGDRRAPGGPRAGSTGAPDALGDGGGPDG